MKIKETDKIKKGNLIIIKVGTSTLTHDTGYLDLRRMQDLARIISDLQNSGMEVILVSSGAQSAGVSKLGIKVRPDSIEGKQAVAAVGQCELMNMYGKFFSEYGKNVAQVLITKYVLENPEQKENAANTFRKLLDMHCIPIVNENDVISYEGINFGGNDILASYVALITNADVIVNLSDIAGLYTKDPRTNPDAELVDYVESVDENILAFASGAGTARGTGGMVAKLQSAAIAAKQHIPMIIANGQNPAILYDIIVNGEFTGTYFANKG